jgi:hypothetical protein
VGKENIYFIHSEGVRLAVAAFHGARSGKLIRRQAFIRSSISVLKRSRCRVAKGPCRPLRVRTRYWDVPVEWVILASEVSSFLASAEGQVWARSHTLLQNQRKNSRKEGRVAPMSIAWDRDVAGTLNSACWPSP